MLIFKKIKIANRILNTYQKLKTLIDENRNCSNDVKEGFDLIKQGAEKICSAVPSCKGLFLDIVEILKNA